MPIQTTLKDGYPGPSTKLYFYYVSLTRNLYHVYLRFQANSETAVREYLTEVCMQDGIWKLPCCNIYTELPDNEDGQIVLTARCGPLYER